MNTLFLMLKQVNLKLSEELVQKAERQAKREGYLTVQEWLRELIRREVLNQGKSHKGESYGGKRNI